MAESLKSNKSVEKNIEPTSNPSASDEIKQEDYQKIKGDAIGDTLYSERFVLSTLLKLTKLEKDLSVDEDFEKDLCNLWDMTIEKDVVYLLLEHKVLEMFASIIGKTEDKRLTEILVGIIGNMCIIFETRLELCETDITAIVDLISCSDTLTLIQLMRFFHTALVLESPGCELSWFMQFELSRNFAENFSFILNNSMNKTLLIYSFEALNAICAKFGPIVMETGNKDIRFRDKFVRTNLIIGVIEAFKTLLPKNQVAVVKLKKSSKTEDDDYDVETSTTIISQKIMSLFLDINVILSQYEEHSKKCYEPILNELMKCISQILEFFTRTIKNSTNEQLKNSLKLHTPRTILKLLSALKASDCEDDIKDCCLKIEKVFENLE